LPTCQGKCSSRSAVAAAAVCADSRAAGTHCILRAILAVIMPVALQKNSMWLMSYRNQQPLSCASAPASAIRYRADFNADLNIINASRQCYRSWSDFNVHSAHPGACKLQQSSSVRGKYSQLIEGLHLPLSRQFEPHTPPSARQQKRLIQAWCNRMAHSTWDRERSSTLISYLPISNGLWKCDKDLGSAAVQVARVLLDLKPCCKQASFVGNLEHFRNDGACDD